MLNMISKLIFEHVHYRGEGLTLVVTLKVLHVFKHEGGGLMMLNNSSRVEKERTLRSVQKAMWTA